MKISNEQIREHLLKAGVKNMIEFGYPHVTIDNILTDEVYQLYFLIMLKENKGKSTKQVDKVIDQLFLEVQGSF